MSSKMLWIQTLPSPWGDATAMLPQQHETQKKSDLVLVKCGAVFFSLEDSCFIPESYISNCLQHFFSNAKFLNPQKLTLSNSPLGWMSHVVGMEGSVEMGSTMSPPWNLSNLLALGYKLFIHLVVTLGELRASLPLKINGWSQWNCLFSLAQIAADARERPLPKLILLYIFALSLKNIQFIHCK